MARYLLIDFGSTFTKLTAVDTDNPRILGTAMAFTTVDEDIHIGYHKAWDSLFERLGTTVDFDRTIACSSAAGGLKMAAVGLVEELTVEAAKRVCLNAGAKVDLVLSHHITRREIKEIRNKNIDIILVAGGANGGNTECVLYNLKLLGEMNIHIPIVYAGNKSCQDDVEDMFEAYGLDGYICDNVMPRINVLDVKNARDTIREIFLRKIIAGKGIKKIENEIDEIVLPTPQAVLNAAELLSRGYEDEEGLGDLVVLDIGGATTDLYSLCNASNRSDVIIHGLEEPYAKRTVEGDLGMRYSAPGIIKSLTPEEKIFINREKNVDIESEVKKRHDDVHTLPENEHDAFVDQYLAEICAYRAMHRHVGRLEEVFTPMGVIYNQIGKDLSEVNDVIGTGGVIINASDQQGILSKLTNVLHNEKELRPLHPTYKVDQNYILAAMGLLGEKEPKAALKIMKQTLKTID